MEKPIERYSDELTSGAIVTVVTQRVRISLTPSSSDQTSKGNLPCPPSTGVRETLQEFRLRVLQRHVQRIEQLILESYLQLLHKKSLADDLRIDQAGLNVLGLQPRITFEDGGRGISSGKHSQDRCMSWPDAPGAT